MIEPIMYLAIGFLVSMLFALMVMPLVHNRAVRLTTRRLEAGTPLSMTEIQADKDQLRADFAMSSRKLETAVELFKARAAAQAAEIGKKTDAIARMKIELDEKVARNFELEERDKTLVEQLKTAEADFERTKAELEAADVAGMAALKASHESKLADLTARLEQWTARAMTAEQQLSSTGEELSTQRNLAETSTRALGETRTRNEVLSGRVSELDRQVAIHREDIDAARNQVRSIEAELSETAAMLSARESENANLRHALDEARTIITTMRNELSAKEGRALTVDRLRSEKAIAEQEKREALDERAKALRELAAVRTQAENAWEVDRMENALLRERIDDIASEVARIALTLEGPHGPIAELLVAEGTREGNSSSLASRIRALQIHAPQPLA